MVIFPPIAQVGCRSASSTVTLRQVGRRAAAERPARGGQREPVDGARPLAGDQLVQRGVLGVDRDQLRARGLRQRHHQLAAHDERLLVGQRDVDPLGERDDRRTEAGRPDDRVEHEVGAALGDEPHQALGPGQHLAAGPGLRGARGGVGVAERDPPDAVRAGLRHERLVRALGRQPDELERLRRACDDVERLRADRARGAEDQEPLHCASMMAGGIKRAEGACRLCGPTPTKSTSTAPVVDLCRRYAGHGPDAHHPARALAFGTLGARLRRATGRR